MLATTGSDASVRLWDVESGAVRQAFRGSSSGGDAAASPDGAVTAER
jgi:hypothetical protein